MQNCERCALANDERAARAWRRQWHFTSDDFDLSFWLDFPDLSYGDAFLYLNTNVFLRSTDSAGNVVLDKNGNPIDTIQGKLFFELPLKELKAGTGFTTSTHSSRRH